MTLQEGIEFLTLSVMALHMAALLSSRPGISKGVMQGEAVGGEFGVNHFDECRIVSLLDTPDRQRAAAEACEGREGDDNHLVHRHFEQ